MSAFEKHYSVPELADVLGMSQGTVRKLFQDEPGVLRKGHGETRGKRAYYTYYIPESVVRRVHAGLTEARTRTQSRTQPRTRRTLQEDLMTSQSDYF
jgi:AraC-like DNA-binding protein